MRALTFVVVAALAAPAAAQGWPSVSTDLPPAGGGANDAALVIGVSNYAFLPAIPGAADNATDWFRYLGKVRGVPQDRLRLLRDNDATKETIEEAVLELANKVGPGGTVWFIFIGHGAPNATHDDGVLVGVDTQLSEKSLIARGVAQKTVLQAIEGDTKHANAIVVWDACFSGSTGDGKTPLVPGSQATVPVKRTSGTGGRAAVFSASDQVAGPLPGHDRPAFTYLLLGSVRGWADKSGDGVVTTLEAFNFTRDTLRTMVTGRTQIPSLSGNAEPFVLATQAREKGPDTIDIFAKLKPAESLFKGHELDIPEIDLKKVTPFALGEVNMAAERAFESAQDAQESTTATSEAKRDAWCSLAGITDKNPYLDIAQGACTQWGSYASAEKEMAANLVHDYGVLADYTTLRRKTTEEKLAAVDSYLSVYGKYADREEVKSAKIGRENLAKGEAPGIMKDEDGDHLIIDACPTEAEDIDGDNDADGCPEQNIGDVASSAVDGVGDAIGDAGDAIEEAGIHFYLFNWSNPFLATGLGAGLGVYDETGVPKRFNEPTFRPSLGWSNRAGWGIFEAGANLDWDLTRDMEDDAFTLDAYGGLRVVGISMWTPSVGVDYRNVGDFAPGRAGGMGVYFGNVINIEDAIHGRLTYRYGLDAPGGIVPVHSVFFELFITVASPRGSALLDLCDELDLCDL